METGSLSSNNLTIYIMTEKMRLTDKVAVVTGAGRGIGKAIAFQLAREGAHMALMARTESELQQTLREIKHFGGKGITHTLDVTKSREVNTAFAKVEKDLGAIDILIANAGIFRAVGPIWKIDSNDWWKDVTTNLLGVFLCCQAVLPCMIKRRGGRIVTMVGGGLLGPHPYGSAYGASKAGLMRFTETLAKEVREYDISVLGLRPGLVHTDMLDRLAQTSSGKRWMPGFARRLRINENIPPDRAAALAANMAAGRFDDFTGRCISVDDDVGEIEKRRVEITEKDLYTLRFRVL